MELTLQSKLYAPTVGRGSVGRLEATEITWSTLKDDGRWVLLPGAPLTPINTEMVKLVRRQMHSGQAAYSNYLKRSVEVDQLKQQLGVDEKLDRASVVKVNAITIEEAFGGVFVPDSIDIRTMIGDLQIVLMAGFDWDQGRAFASPTVSLSSLNASLLDRIREEGMSMPAGTIHLEEMDEHFDREIGRLNALRLSRESSPR